MDKAGNVWLDDVNEMVNNDSGMIVNGLQIDMKKFKAILRSRIWEWPFQSLKGSSWTFQIHLTIRGSKKYRMPPFQKQKPNPGFIVYGKCFARVMIIKYLMLDTSQGGHLAQ